MSKQRYVIGIDVGGTFTDLLAYDEIEGRLLAAKVPSMPGAQWQGVLDALEALEIELSTVRAFVHGTTIATNALLERKGAKTALVTTAGFRDVLEIGKGRRLTGGLFDTTWQRPAPLVPRDRRHEISERIDAVGQVIAAPSAAATMRLASALRGQGVEAVAVAFVNSYRNAENERVVAEGLRSQLGGVPVTESAALIPERGEFERTSTAALNAYLTPVMTAYLDKLSGIVKQRGVVAPINIMGSNGGAMTLEEAAVRCAGTFLSGPVGGANGAIHVSAAAGIRDVITFDMGGTSTDVALIHDLQPRMSHDNQIDAFPLRMPQLDIHTIGAGGGSIVSVGRDRTLRIGPQSAGAVPGPACYGRGGDKATISDANLILGRLAADRPLAGGLRLEKAAAERVFRPLADALDTGELIVIAEAAIAVAVAKMAGAVREVSVHRGFDPREFTLVCFGGAGPMHGFLVAEELGMERVLIPRYPGHLSALGQMLADLRKDFVKAWGGRLGAISLDELTAEVEALRLEGAASLVRDGVPAGRHTHRFTLDMRYAGQSYTLGIPWSPGTPGFAPLRAAFDARHEETFGYIDKSNDAEIVNIRLVSIGEVDKPTLDYSSGAYGAPDSERREVWFGGWRDAMIFRRRDLPSGHEFAGPAIVEEEGGTTVVPPGWTVRTDEGGAMIGTANASDVRR